MMTGTAAFGGLCGAGATSKPACSAAIGFRLSLPRTLDGCPDFFAAPLLFAQCSLDFVATLVLGDGFFVATLLVLLESLLGILRKGLLPGEALNQRLGRSKHLR
jgi:hypothetical protein